MTMPKPRKACKRCGKRINSVHDLCDDCRLTWAKPGTLALWLTLAAAGCGSTLPADTMTRFAETLEATKHAYLALCSGREESPECAHILESVNVAITTYTQLNNTLKESP